MITKDALIKAIPECKSSKLDLIELCKELTRVFVLKKNEATDLSNQKRRAAFIAQCAHESGYFKTFTENLNYSAEALMRVFPSRFLNAQIAEGFARNPEKIANQVYSNRMGNGAPETGEGWKYRGRGLIQLTGKNNYAGFTKDMGIDVIENPDYLTTVAGAVDSAYWFWTKNPKISAAADKDDIAAMTKIINGGHHGLQNRIDLYNRVLTALNALN